MRDSLPTKEWMLERIDVRGEDECWPWRLHKDRHGYGRVSLRQFGLGQIYASKASYLVFNGPINDGEVVRHTCDNRECCNPAHLITGSQMDNVRDSISRGRRNKAGKFLTPSDVEEIKYLLAMGLGTTLVAQLFGTTKSSVKKIRSGDVWKDVPWPHGYTRRV